MPLDEKYQTLALTDKYVSDPLLLVLAWKKSQDYIQRTSWYADNFALDLSALDLQVQCADWSAALGKGMLTFEEMELVPAPKSALWTFTKNACSIDVDECLTWGPETDKGEDGQKRKLRSLAHIGIREQTLMTQVMMCLANVIEAKQGDPSISFDHVHQHKVFSYGNRLQCRYEEGSAYYSYGSTKAYRKYFEDYQQFLKRPQYFAAKARDEIEGDQQVYIVELDLKQFFNHVDREKLIGKILQLTKVHGATGANAKVKKLLTAFKQWAWSETSTQRYRDLYENSDPPRGLPQGLVASGFLANVYLLDFDEKVGADIGEHERISYLPFDCGIQSLNDATRINATLIDYCRYVDDMRFVVVASKKSSKSNIKNVVEAFINRHLSSLQLELEINPNKTKVIAYHGYSRGISKELSNLQSQLSGPMTLDDVQNNLEQISSLLDFGSAGNHLPEQNCECTINRLAYIERSYLDQREETLKRFAASRIVKLLREARHLSAHKLDASGNLIPCDWDYQQERYARRFIGCWSYDPSLLLLLKYGLELFPCSRVLIPVLDQLERCLKNDQLYMQAVARYCLAEIFRHTATVIHCKDPKLIPVHAQTDEFFELLQKKAVDAIAATKDDKFDFLAEQAQFLLLVRGDNCVSRSRNASMYRLIFLLTAGERTIPGLEQFTATQQASAIIIAEQLVGEKQPLLRASACLLEACDEAVIDVLKRVAAQIPDFFASLIRHARRVGYNWVKLSGVAELVQFWGINKRPLQKPLEQIDGKQSLLRLIQRTDNPFTNEIMALKLMQALLKDEEWQKNTKEHATIDLAESKVAFQGYSNPPQFAVLDKELSVTVVLQKSDFSLMSPHLTQTENHDIWVLQRVAMCVRTALTGSVDWTTHPRYTTDDRIGYRGIKSTPYKRMLGLITTPYSIGGESAEVADWFTSLLTQLLIWPGVQWDQPHYSWPEKWTLANVRGLVDKRLERLKKQYCRLSGMPGLLEKVYPDWDQNKKHLNVVMVQSKMPAKNDFDRYGLLLDDPLYRAAHRKHITNVAVTTYRHILAQRVSLTDTEEDPSVDLIIWPELAVHPDDLDILKTLSRKTRAIIYAGMTFIKQPNVKGPNNCAIWIVPTKRASQQKELIRYQGKWHMMADEVGQVEPWRPYQLMLELMHPHFPNQDGFVLTGSICYDATDIALSADLRNKSNAYLISALNQDINTFDSMIDALHYHMFQPVVLVNSGEFGGSYAKAPYKEHYHRLIAHSHGNNQVSINTFEMNLFDFRRDGLGASFGSGKTKKAVPAGVEKLSK